MDGNCLKAHNQLAHMHIKIPLDSQFAYNRDIIKAVFDQI